MRILVVHGYYQQRGGEDVIFDAERVLLSAHGHQVAEFTLKNDEIAEYGIPQRVRLFVDTVYNLRTKKQLKEALRVHKPDIVHVHNTFPIVSLSVIDACWECGIPIVQTLYNYRLMCVRGTLCRDGRVCEECIGRVFAWPGVIHRCYRQSFAGSLIVAVMQLVHKLRRTHHRVGALIAMSATSREKYIEWGLPARSLFDKQNFVTDRVHDATPAVGEYALFVGRLTTEKGVLTLMEAWNELRGIPLKIAGSGPLQETIEADVKSAELREVQVLGNRDSAQIHALLQRAAFLVMSSEWYETFGMVIIEAFSHGVPVIASNLGCMQENVRDQQTGLLFTPGDPHDLAKKVRWAWDNPDEMRRMGREAREEYLSKYTPDIIYARLMEIYEAARAGQGKKEKD